MREDLIIEETDDITEIGAVSEETQGSIVKTVSEFPDANYRL